MQIKGINESDKHLQLAEECGELLQSLCKLRRIEIGRNRSPMTLKTAIGNMAEEFGDVVACMFSIFDDNVYRWMAIAQEYDDFDEEIGFYNMIGYLSVLITDTVNARDALLEAEENTPSLLINDPQSPVEFVVAMTEYCTAKGISIERVKQFAEKKLTRWKLRQEGRYGEISTEVPV